LLPLPGLNVTLSLSAGKLSDSEPETFGLGVGLVTELLLLPKGGNSTGGRSSLPPPRRYDVSTDGGNGGWLIFSLDTGENINQQKKQANAKFFVDSKLNFILFIDV